MNYKKFFPMTLLLILTLILAACGGDDGDSNDSDSGGSGSSSVPELSETATAGDEFTGTVTVKYPAGWASEAEFGNVSLADSQATLDSGADDQISAGQFLVQLQPIPTDALTSLSLTEEAGPAEVLNIFSDLFAGDETTTANFGDVESFTTNGRDAALLSGTISEGDQTTDAALIATKLDTGYVILILATYEGELNNTLETVKAMAGEVTFELPAS